LKPHVVPWTENPSAAATSLSTCRVFPICQPSEASVVRNCSCWNCILACNSLCASTALARGSAIRDFTHPKYTAPCHPLVDRGRESVHGDDAIAVSAGHSRGAYLARAEATRAEQSGRQNRKKERLANRPSKSKGAAGPLTSMEAASTVPSFSRRGDRYLPPSRTIYN
jgi:hypothetical protein